MTEQQQKTYEYIPFLEVSQQLCNTPQSRDTLTALAVYCYCWQDRGGRCLLWLGRSQGHNLQWWEDRQQRERQIKQVREKDRLTTQGT